MIPKYDIVQILKEDINPEELKYSLRSVEQYFPHGKVWFVCGQPKGLTPDGRIEHKQTGNTKWERARSSLEKIVECGDISENFFLFNDDFFVLKRPQLPFINYTNGTLEKRIKDIERRNGCASSYTRNLTRLYEQLLMKHCDTMSFTVHLPLLVNKALLAHTLQEFPTTPMFRSAYGNLNNIPYISHKDMKIYDMNSIPEEDWDYVSTTEDTFAKGQVGKWIKEKFPEPSRYEGPYTRNVKELYTEEGEDRYHVFGN